MKYYPTEGYLLVKVLPNEKFKQKIISPYEGNKPSTRGIAVKVNHKSKEIQVDDTVIFREINNGVKLLLGDDEFLVLPETDIIVYGR